MTMQTCTRCGERFVIAERYDFCPHLRKAGTKIVAPPVPAPPPRHAAATQPPVPSVHVGAKTVGAAAVDEDLTGQRAQDGTEFFEEVHQPTREVNVDGNRFKIAGRRVFKYDDGGSR